MLKITFDYNAVIDLEENNPDGVHVRQLVQLHRDAKVNLAIPAIQASENQRGGSLENFADFQARLNRVGLGSIKLLLPVGIWDLTFWDHCVWSSPEWEKLITQIHEAMFPTVPPELEKVPKRKWRNRKCDVLAIASHIMGKRDVFVTRDPDFFKVRVLPKLIELGAGSIVGPAEAVRLLTGGAQKRIIGNKASG